MTLANLLTQDNSGLRDVAKYINQPGNAAPYVALVLLSVLVTLVAGYLLWNHLRRQKLQPGSRALLKRLGDMLGIAADHRRLLWQLGRAVELEPAAALVSPGMLIEMVHRIERRGEKLSAEQAAQVAEILAIVAAASEA